MVYTLKVFFKKEKVADISATTSGLFGRLFSARTRGALTKSFEHGAFPPDLQQSRLLKDIANDFWSE
jgi:hypothetical protein